jgi:DNA-binding NarL/FixJ family response regulator
MSKLVRILIADDHELVRKGLRAVLQSHDGWTVCGEAATGREAVEQALALRPHVVVMDLTMPELGGLEATRQIRRQLRGTEVLILTMHHSEQLIHEVLAAGARGYLLKTDAGHAVLDAVESLSRHQPFFTPGVSELLLSAYFHPERSTTGHTAAALALTPREREVVQLIAEGKSSKEIATALNISEATAETHRTNLMRKLDIHSVSEIVRYAIRNHLIEP